MFFKWREYFLIKKSELFDSDYYLFNNPDVRNANINPLIHFINFGWIEGRDPSKDFNTKYYLSTNPELIKSGINPLIHYIRYYQPNPISYSDGKIEEKTPIKSIDKPMNIFQRVVAYTRKYGVTNLLKKIKNRIFNDGYSAFSPEFITRDNIFDKDIDPQKEPELLLLPMTCYTLQNSGKRINLILDKFTKDKPYLVSIIFATYLAEKYKSKLRIVTRISVADKTFYSEIIHKYNLSPTYVEFVYIPAGNDQLSLPIGKDDMFIINSFESILCMQDTFNLNKFIFQIPDNGINDLKIKFDKLEFLKNLSMKFSLKLVCSYNIYYEIQEHFSLDEKNQILPFKNFESDEEMLESIKNLVALFNIEF